ncbi:MAG TPA: ATP-binding protein, partial [Roseiflexaceae bacterium]
QALPAALEELGRRFAAETGSAVTTSLALTGPRLPARIEEALYRIAQEALVNVRRHAQAAAVQLDLRLAGDHVRLTIADDGRGFDADQPADPAARAHGHGFGLIGMRERARLLNGTMQICSSSGAGTRVEVAIPLG